jgi:catechol 2,3-dioxygenase-like lactoylglutathione lyase family enzyme
MSAKIKHIAIVSDQYALEGRFYEAVFGMKTAADTRPERAVTVSDGYVGLNINPRKAGRPAGLDHFGVEVEDVERTCARLRERYPAIEVLKRPGTRPFAGISTHDPAGNLFDLSQKSMENRASVYVEPPREQARTIDHLALRTLHFDEVAEFYVDLFGFERLARKAGDPNHYLSDGRITLILMPWSILDYEGGGIARPGPDHIGFRVESLQAVKERLQTVGDDNPRLRPFPLGTGPEGQARLALFERCPCGAHHLADPDGVLLDLAEK